MTGAAGSGDRSSKDRFREYRETGSRSLRNELVQEHLHIADYHARRFGQRGVPVEDLRQTALLAMLRAVDRYDPDRGVEFSTFAGRTVEGELKRWFRDRAWAVRPPRGTQERFLALRRTQDELEQRLQRSPTVPELADALDCSVDDVLAALEAGSARSATSISPHPRDDDARGDAELTEPAPAGYVHIEDQMLVDHLLDSLPERERKVIVWRFFDGLDQSEIAERIGVSQSYLSRLLRKVLLELRARAEEEGTQ